MSSLRPNVVISFCDDSHANITKFQKQSNIFPERLHFPTDFNRIKSFSSAIKENNSTLVKGFKSVRASIKYDGFNANDKSPEAGGLAEVEATLNSLSWLRVSQRFHTASQVCVGAVIGSIFSIFWCWAWNNYVSKLV